MKIAAEDWVIWGCVFNYHWITHIFGTWMDLRNGLPLVRHDARAIATDSMRARWHCRLHCRDTQHENITNKQPLLRSSKMKTTETIHITKEMKKYAHAIWAAFTLSAGINSSTEYSDAFVQACLKLQDCCSWTNMRSCWQDPTRAWGTRICSE